MNDIKINTDTDVPLDQKLMDLFTEAYTKNFHCYKAIIKFDSIKPFSDYVPEITRGDLDKFEHENNNGELNYLFVYQDGDVFIMSDDYHKYYCYKILGLNEIPCVVLGEPAGEGVLFKGKTFLLSTPEIKIVEK